MTASLIERINDLFNNNDYSEVVNLFLENIDIIINQKDKIHIYHLVAKSYYQLGKNKEAFTCINKVKDFINIIDPPPEKSIEINLDFGRILRRLGKREKAKSVYQEILKNFRECLNDELYATIFHNLANIYLELGIFDKSSDYFNKALEIDKRTENHRGLSLSYSGLGNLCFYLGQFEEAIEFYKKSLKFRRKAKDLMGEALVLLNIGSSYASILDKNNAESYLEDSLKIFQKFNHEKGIQEALITKARVNFNLSKYATVIESLKFIEESTTYPQGKQHIELANILIESMIRNEEFIRAEKLVERNIETLEKADLVNDESLYEEYGKMKQLLSLIKFQLDKIEETIHVLEELEQTATNFKDIQSLVVVFFSKANVYYQIDSLEEAIKYAKKSENLAKRIHHESLPLITDLLFRINLRTGNFSECMKFLKRQKRVYESDSHTIGLILNSFRIFANDKLKSNINKILNEKNIFHLTLLILQYLFERILQNNLQLTKLSELESNIMNKDTNLYELLIPYFLQAKMLVTDVDFNKEYSIDPDRMNIETAYTKILLDGISKEELSKIIDTWKNNEELDQHQILMILNVIYYAVENDLISNESLKSDSWIEKADESYKEIVKIKQEFLHNLADTESIELFSFDNTTPTGYFVSSILQEILPKIYEIKGITQKQQKITLVFLIELILRTLVLLFIR